MSKDPESQHDEEMLAEYDFRGGVRGKHFRAYQQGHTVEIHKADGSTETRRFTVERGAALLDPPATRE